MLNEKFARLIKQRFLSEEELFDIIAESSVAGKFPEDLLFSKGIGRSVQVGLISEGKN
jgi:hypothetical protein